MFVRSLPVVSDFTLVLFDLLQSHSGHYIGSHFCGRSLAPTLPNLTEGLSYKILRFISEAKLERIDVLLTMIQKQPVVLVVDDEPAITEMLEMLLEEDYEVNICLYPLKAVQQAHFIKPDLLIVDLMMPALNGIDLLRRLRHEPDLAEVPAILMTASTSLRQVGINEDELQDLKASVILKPFDNNKLTDMMKNLYQPHHPNSIFTRS